MSESSTPRLADVIRQLVEIIRFRGGPEDLPASSTLLIYAIAGGVIMRAGMLGILPMPFEGSPALIIACGVGFSLLYLSMVLRVARRPERFLQTATAVFGTQAVLAPVLLFTAWFFLTYVNDPALQLPAMLLRLATEVWVLAVVGRILRSATDWPLFVCVMLAIANELLTYLVISGLFPQAGTVPAPV